MNNFLFNKSLIIGVGLIGSSLARGLKNKKLSKLVFGYDNDNNVKKKCMDLKIVDSMLDTLDLIEEIDLVVLCTPLSCYRNILSKITPLIKKPCIITDVGSTKANVIKDFESAEVTKQIESEILELKSILPNSGVPKFFIQGKEFQGKRTIERFSNIVEEELKKLN